MKNLIHTFFTLTTIAVLSAASCKKNNTTPPDNPYGLPNATKTGMNTFACLINGNKWISQKGISYMGAEISGDTLSLKGSPYFDNYFADLYLQIKGGLQQESSYEINNTLNSAIYVSNSTCLGVTSNVININGINGNIKLTKLDKINKIVSGLFDFELPIPNCDTLKVTDGRFDMRYR